jgi:hypothetical protein
MAQEPGRTYRTVPYGPGKEALTSLCDPGRRIRFSFEWTAQETRDQNTRPTWTLFPFPDGKGLGKSTVTRWALFDGENGAAAVRVDDRYIEPPAFFEKLLVPLRFGLVCGKSYDEEAVRHLDG